MKPTYSLTLVGLWLASVNFCHANAHKVYYKGSEAVAQQSSVPPGTMNYLGAVPAGDPNNLAAPSCGAAPCNTNAIGAPNQVVTFLHPYTNKAITVPLTLPVGKPTVVVKNDRIVYDYGFFSHKVVVRFLPGGLVEVNYRG